jgi:hypothetical protein
VSLYFEGRELKSYGEFVRSADLEVGRVYFRMGYVDADSALPELAPLVFLGRNLDPEHPGLYFQDAASYLDGERYESIDWAASQSEPDEGPEIWRRHSVEFHVLPETQYASVFEYEKALDQLLACSLSRKTWDGHLRPIKRPPDTTRD